MCEISKQVIEINIRCQTVSRTMFLMSETPNVVNKCQDQILQISEGPLDFGFPTFDSFSWS